MPTYKYECKSCGHMFEKFQSIKDDPVKKCPECGKKVEKIITPGAGVIFKGSGFYQTDYKCCPAKEGSSPADKKASCGCDGCSSTGEGK